MNRATGDAEIARLQLAGVTVAIVEDTVTDEVLREVIKKLSERELQVAALVAQGYATKNIAYELQNRRMDGRFLYATHLREVGRR